jgi:nudix-type nucleoside diphosphatase (YffH/AdpP family)
VDAEIIDKTVEWEGWSRLLLVRARTARGTEVTRTVEDHGSAASVLPYDPARRVALLVRQLRVPMLLAHSIASTLEAPAGLVDSDDPALCVRREAMEEAGLRLAEVEAIGRVFPMPGVSTEAIDLFLAEYRSQDRVGKGGGLADEQEEIEVVEVPLAELADLADRGALQDLKTLALLQALRHRRPELFG